tara:strand:- start:1762 stop:2181 length:420 start_codon:yes stop_codon:yes gene_type:complete
MSYKIVAKYIQNLNFNIPNPKIFSLLSKNISDYKINIDIKSNQLKDNLIEVITTLNLMSSKKDDLEKIVTKIDYASIVEINKDVKDKSDIERIILIQVPTEIYPELRKLFVFIFEKSGFKEIKISESVDFQKLYDVRNN